MTVSVEVKPFQKSPSWASWVARLRVVSEHGVSDLIIGFGATEAKAREKATEFLAKCRDIEIT